MNRAPFAPGEWYHCYGRGVDKRTVFETAADYRRFTQLLYLSNSETPLHRSNVVKGNVGQIFELERGSPLVEVGAYCLMPNHFHLLLKDATEEGGGVSRFMQKLGTGFTMYFNKSRERVGNLFVKPFRAKHVADDEYLKRVAQYIHFNPIELFEPGWKEGKVASMTRLEEQLRKYEHSSMPQYQGAARSQNAIIDPEALALLSPDADDLALHDALTDMLEYYRTLR